MFLHTFPVHAEMWNVTLGAVPEGWRAIAPDLRGLGQTPLPESDHHRMNDFAGDVIDLLDLLEIPRAAVVGCSLGGYVLFEMLNSAPNYVGAIGLVSTRPGADNEEGRTNRDKMIDLVDREGVEAVASQMVAKLLGKTTQSERPDQSHQVGNLVKSNTAAGVKTAVRAMKDRRDFTPLVARIDVPTLIVHGTGRRAYSARRSREHASQYQTVAARAHIDVRTPSKSGAARVVRRRVVAVPQQVMKTIIAVIAAAALCAVAHTLNAQNYNGRSDASRRRHRDDPAG